MIKDSQIARLESLTLPYRQRSIFHYLLLAVITLLAAGLRFYRLGEWSFWIEEHHSLRHAAALDSLPKVIQSARPLFYLISKPVLNYWGVSELSARIIPVFLGIISVPLTYVLTKRFFGFFPALLSTLLLVFSPWHIYWSQNARFYTLLLLLYTLSIFAFYWGLETDRFRYIVLSFMALALAVISHAIAALLVPIFLAYVLILKMGPFEKPPGLRLRNIVPFVVLPLVGYLLYEATLVFYLGSKPFIYEIYLLFFNEATASFVGYGNPYVMVTAVVYRIGVPLAYLSLFGAYYLLRDKSRIGLCLVLGAYFPLAIFSVLTIFATTTSRYAFMSLPFWVILTAVGLTELYKRVQTDKRGLLWLLGLPIVLYRDPAVEDIVYYLSHKSAFVLFFVFIVLIGLLGFGWYDRRRRMAKQTAVLLWLPVTLFFLLAHPILVDELYFAYQDGYRDNWKAAAALIHDEKGAADMVVSAIPPMVNYYLDENTLSIEKINLNTILQNGNPVWLIEESGLEQGVDRHFYEWAQANCIVVGNWDHYVSGRLWKMRVYRCEPAG